MSQTDRRSHHNERRSRHDCHFLSHLPARFLAEGGPPPQRPQVRRLLSLTAVPRRCEEAIDRRTTNETTPRWGACAERGAAPAPAARRRGALAVRRRDRRRGARAARAGRPAARVAPRGAAAPPRAQDRAHVGDGRRGAVPGVLRRRGGLPARARARPALARHGRVRPAARPRRQRGRGRTRGREDMAHEDLLWCL